MEFFCGLDVAIEETVATHEDDQVRGGGICVGESGNRFAGRNSTLSTPSKYSC